MNFPSDHTVEFFYYIWKPVTRKKFEAHIEMAMGTHDLVGFSSIRRRVWAKFCTRGFVSGINIVPNGFAGLGLVFLNPDPLPVYPDQNC
jgi:hypothetical protein